MDQERTWIGQIQNGDSRGFHQLYEHHHRKLYALCYRFTGNPAEAEDQLQEIFMRLLKKLDTFRGDASFATWAHRLAVNHLLNYTSRNKRKAERPLEDAQHMTAKQERNSNLAILLQDAITRLPDGFRRVFILHDQQGFKHGDIAEILGISPATSRSQLARARLALRELLKPHLTPMERPA